MRKSSLLIIFLIVFIDLVGFGIVIPILPYYAQHYGANAQQLGWLLAIYSLMQFLVSPIWGWISDRVGRRPVLLLSLLGSCFSMMLLGLAGNLHWLFVGRLLAGASGANISTAYAYVTDVTTEEDRTRGMGMIGAAFGLGFIFGPAIGGMLSRYGFDMPMFAGAALAFFNFLFAFWKLEEPNLSAATRFQNRSRRLSLDTLRATFGDMRSAVATLLFLLATFAFSQMETVFAIYLGARYQYDAESAGILLAIMGLVMAVVQGGMIGKLADRFGIIKLIFAGSVLCSLALLGFSSATSIAVVILTLIILAVGHGVLHPSLSSLASLGSPALGHGATMGVFHSAGSLARVLGPPSAGWLYDKISWRMPFLSASVVLGTVALLSVMFGVAFRVRMQKSPPAETSQREQL